MLAVAVICAVLALAAAQDYACTPADYCTSQGYDRVDTMGCTYFCYMDVEPPTGLTCSEFHLAYADWKGSAAECDAACFYSATKAILPQACDSEITGTYDILAAFDDNPATISGQDIESWCQYVFALEPTDVISPRTFEIFWNILYAEVGVESC